LIHFYKSFRSVCYKIKCQYEFQYLGT